MKIGELASRTGLAASRIRFYEASGLISAQRQANGYRRYPEQAVQTLGIISCAQQAGFSLDEIRRLTLHIEHQKQQTKNVVLDFKLHPRVTDRLHATLKGFIL